MGSARPTAPRSDRAPMNCVEGRLPRRTPRRSTLTMRLRTRDASAGRSWMPALILTSSLRIIIIASACYGGTGRAPLETWALGITRIWSDRRSSQGWTVQGVTRAARIGPLRYGALGHIGPTGTRSVDAGSPGTAGAASCSWSSPHETTSQTEHGASGSDEPRKSRGRHV